MSRGFAPSPMIERFWSRVIRRGDDECWPWQGHLDEWGYGRIGYGSRKHRGRYVRAHRFSFELHHGPVGRGLLVMHRCDNPACVNPGHLRQGTNDDNMKDMAQKGRAANQALESNGNVKLKIGQVVAIRDAYLTGVISQQTIADIAGIGQSQVSRIIRGAGWKQ